MGTFPHCGTPSTQAAGRLRNLGFKGALNIMYYVNQPLLATLTGLRQWRSVKVKGDHITAG